MQKTTTFNTLLSSLKADYPDLTFKKGERFAWHLPKTIYYSLPESPESCLLLLHELGHALLNHQDFDKSIDRVKMERAAWEKARELAIKYQIPFDDNLVEDKLDSYRAWLHDKSVCPKCGLTRFEGKNGFTCPNCDILLKNQKSPI